MEQSAPQSPLPVPTNAAGGTAPPAAVPPYAPQMQYQTVAAPTSPEGIPVPPAPPPTPIQKKPSRRLLVSALVLMILLVVLGGGGFVWWRFIANRQNVIPIDIDDQPITTHIKVNKLILTEPGFLAIKWFDFSNGVMLVASTIYLEPDTYTDFAIKVNDNVKEFGPIPPGARMLAVGTKDVNGNENLDKDEDFPIQLPNGKSMQIEFRSQ